MADIVIFAEQSVSGFELNSAYSYYSKAISPAPFTLVDGETYRITWDDDTDEYQAITANVDGMEFVCVGNGAVIGGANNGKKFAMGYNTATGFMNFFALEPGESHRVAVYQIVEDVVTDDADYLIKGSTLTAIAEAIRGKTGKKDPIPVLNMATEIGNITGGGGGSSEDFCYVTFMNHDGTVEYGKKAVAKGDDCADPVERGLFSKPTREKDERYWYTFKGWANTRNGTVDANWNKSVTKDKTLYAFFSTTPRTYTIAFWDGDDFIDSKIYTYGDMPAMAPPSKVGYTFAGWVPELTQVTGNADYYASWEELHGFTEVLTMAKADFSVSGGFDNGQFDINNDGTLLAATFSGWQTSGHTVYNISGDTPSRLTNSDSIKSPSRAWFNHDGTQVFASGTNSSNRYAQKLYSAENLTSLSTVSSFSGTERNNPIACSSVADLRGWTAGSNTAGRTWNSSDGTSFNTGLGNFSYVCYSPDGKHLAPYGTSEGLKVFTLDGTLVADTTDFANTSVVRVSYNSDGSLLAVSYSQAPWVEVYETTNYTKVCDLSDILSATSFAQFASGDALVVGSGTSVIVRTITEAGHEAYEYNIPAYAGTAEIKGVWKNHNGTRFIIHDSNGITVWALT